MLYFSTNLFQWKWRHYDNEFGFNRYIFLCLYLLSVCFIALSFKRRKRTQTITIKNPIWFIQPKSLMIWMRMRIRFIFIYIVVYAGSIQHKLRYGKCYASFVVQYSLFVFIEYRNEWMPNCELRGGRELYEELADARRGREDANESGECSAILI